MRGLIILLILLTISIHGFSQESTYASPVDHPITLSGSFGELRTGHFHQALDIRASRGVSGDRIYSSQKGYISRIAVSGDGYGNVLYINHPDGYTTVYAHLKNFRPDIAAYVKKNQYETKSFNVDLTCDSTLFVVGRKEFIAEMGNTGRSFGPHLHFEVRETATDLRFNPMAFGIGPKDTKAPRFDKLKVIGRDYLGNITHHQILPIIKVSTGVYRLPCDTVFVDGHEFSLSIKAYDGMNGSRNKNGIHAMRTYQNEVLINESVFKTMKRDDGKWINLYLDYESKSMDDEIFYKMNGISKIPFTFYSSRHSKEEDNTQNSFFQFEAEDFNLNISMLQFFVELIPPKIKEVKNPKIYRIKSLEDNVISLDNIKVKIPAKSVYANQKCMFQKSLDVLEQQDVTVIQLGDPKIPLLKPMEVHILDSFYKDSLAQKLALISVNKKEEKKLYRGILDSLYFKAELQEFGSYIMYIDTIPPEIIPLQQRKSFATNERMSFKIMDNLKPVRSADYISYKVFIDDQWYLAEYDHKKTQININIDPFLTTGTHQLKLQVEDWAGNQNWFEQSLIIRPFVE